MFQVLVTLSERPNKTHPFAVVIIDPQGQRSQEMLSATLREARICGNGVIMGMRHMCYTANDALPINVTIDPIFDLPNQ